MINKKRKKSICQTQGPLYAVERPRRYDHKTSAVNIKADKIYKKVVNCIVHSPKGYTYTTDDTLSSAKANNGSDRPRSNSKER